MMRRKTTAKTKQTLSPLKIAGIYIGTVVGAGFASGQEVLQYFGYHGSYGTWGIAISTVLFIAFGGIAFLLGHRLNATSHLELVRESAGPWVGRLIDGIITFFLLGAFTAMAAGSGAIFQEQYGIPSIWGNVAMVVASVVTVLFGVHGVLSAIGFVAPFLVGAVLTVSTLILLDAPVQWNWLQPQQAAVGSWPLSSLIYVSYNMVLAVAVLGPTGALAEEDNLRKGAVLGGLGLGVGVLAIHLAILTQVPEAARFEVPMLYLIRRIDSLAPVYSAVLLAEVYTTAAGSLYGFVARIAGSGHLSRQLTIGSGILGFVGSLVGFSELVASLYSLVGYAGLVLLGVLLIGYLRNRG